MTSKQKKQLPKFKTRAEEAAFWDNLDLADAWSEFKPIDVKFAQNLSEPMSMRLDTKTLDALRKQAAKKGIGPTTLARMWIMERLEQEGAVAQGKPRRRKAS